MSEELKEGWYKCIDLESFRLRCVVNPQIINDYFIDGRIEVLFTRDGEGYANATDLSNLAPAISLVEWGMFEPCDPPMIGEEDKPNYDTPVEPEVDYKVLFEELLEVTENSDGVSGLHQNGDIATWDELENNNWLPLLKEWKEKQHA